jgi:hypothetical protein
VGRLAGARAARRRGSPAGGETEPDAAGAADWISITPQDWPTGPVLMTAIVPLRQNTAAGYLGVIEPGTVFWGSDSDAVKLGGEQPGDHRPARHHAAPGAAADRERDPGVGAGKRRAAIWRGLPNCSMRRSGAVRQATV